jgi:Transcriptional regulator containing PAS, AAA-type ATPase, and DNA-binding domains
MKNLAVVALSKNTSCALREQLYKLLGGHINITDYHVESNMPWNIEADLVLFASQASYKQARCRLRRTCPVLIARRSINYHEVNKLFEIPAGTDVLLVNDIISSANQTIALLQTLGINHLNYYAYAPGMKNYPQLKIAVTPGEREVVPECVEQVVDIKTRLIDITTLVELLGKLGMLEFYADFLSANYVRDIIQMIKDGQRMLCESDQLKSEIRRLEDSVRRQRLQENTIAKYTFADIIGCSKTIERTRELAKKMAAADATILIQGGNGTGKELIAQSIHNVSPRRSGPFVAVNFAALTENLLESELFGYVDGAFTGAARGGAPGLFEAAQGGTIFLDEIGDAPLSFQVKLLRVLQEHQIRRVGSTKFIPIDVRAIVATNQDLKYLIQQGRFREDLYYRLNVLPIHMPALRERSDDILLLAESFYLKHTGTGEVAAAAKYFRWVAPYLRQYSWPGNIRELQNVVEYLINVCPDASPQFLDLPEDMRCGCAHIPSAQQEKRAWKQRICEEVILANAQSVSIGRRSLAEKLLLPENQIRLLVRELEVAGILLLQKGRKGLRLNQQVYEEDEAAGLENNVSG